MAHWIALLDDISVDLISKEDKARVEALVWLKIPEQDRAILFRGDEGAVAARLKELMLQGAGAVSPCVYHPVDMIMSPIPLSDAFFGAATPI